MVHGRLSSADVSSLAVAKDEVAWRCYSRSKHRSNTDETRYPLWPIPYRTTSGADSVEITGARIEIFIRLSIYALGSISRLQQTKEAFIAHHFWEGDAISSSPPVFPLPNPLDLQVYLSEGFTLFSRRRFPIGATSVDILSMPFLDPAL